jgi:hypothetical protein
VRAPLKLAYFVHDLTDPAVSRRLGMLKAGGAEAVVLGFRRAEAAPSELEGCPTVDLGRTYDARLGHRARMTARAALASGRHRALIGDAEVVLARSLEMLAVAHGARATCGLGAPVVYECLDIHRVMLGDGLKSRLLRAVERRLMRWSTGLLVSSPAFLDAYFRRRQDLGIPALLVENKVLELEGETAVVRSLPAGPPWRIGWLGAIRCRRSLDILTELAGRRPDLIEVRIHGRPAYAEFEDFDAKVASVPNVAFGGAYTAAHLPSLYGAVHFSWAIDFMEEGLNSAWLLPNRIYESGRYGAAPIALLNVQTGRWLAERHFGVRLADVADLEAFLDALTLTDYAALQAAQQAVPLEAFRADRASCRDLVEWLRKPSPPDGSDGEASGHPKARLAA